ncbi:MAG: B12-binding domain-containing radical SAM protein [Burkholderiales bacterium]|nr:B12-binding domain-containing radical SAM protein [Burkholderiales bacterium]
MRVFLVHVRDPQFYAIPDTKRAKNGRLRVMGFPPIGIMSLSSVLKRAGHEVVMFDQANPETPNEAIIEEIRRQRPALVGLSFLSTTSYPYAKILARQIRAVDANVKLAFGGVFASLNAQLVKMQVSEVDFVCRGDGEQLILDLLDRLDDPDTIAGVTWQERDGKLRHNASRPLERNLDQWPFPDRESLALDFVESMPLDVPAVLSLERFTTMQTSRGCPWPCVFCDIPVFNEGKWRSRSPEHVIAEMKQLQADGYGAVYFVDDHFLLQPRRIQTICKGINDNDIRIQWGCEGRVDSTCMELFPAMAKAHCRTLMFGLESGSQKVLDRLQKEQTLEEAETAVDKAKDAGIEIVHGFFVVGCPGETEEEMRETFRFASRLRIDTFGFNRLCVYRGTPLWQDYVRRGLVNDATDWYKYFKCSSIDPTVLPGETIHRIRQEGLRHLIVYKLTHYPIQALRLLYRFFRHMPARDVLHLLAKPFLGPKGGMTNAEVVSRAVEHADLKSDAAELTQVSDDALEHAIRESRAERARIQAAAEVERRAA